jgi:hypothetical protein
MFLAPLIIVLTADCFNRLVFGADAAAFEYHVRFLARMIHYVLQIPELHSIPLPPFPHRVHTTPERTVTRFRVQAVLPEVRTIICAECDHMITRTVDGCDCETRCHELASVLASLGVTG